ncbi:hypothetical protein IAQ61_007126 [Plenodomus lingam]|uniref:uncharacterized protein n=1 Tax=Leptosphaeria maculans TaxID=5022 RepID=UPI0033185B8E|nr:hypothetical protein IAQ61_007126 [Plenodomus lingam]
MPGVPSKWCSSDILEIRHAAYNLLPQLPIEEGEKVNTRSLHELIIVAVRHVGLDWVPGDKLVHLAVMMGIVCALVAQKLREENGFFDGLCAFELNLVVDASVNCLAGSMDKVELGWDANANVDRLADRLVERLGPQSRWGA